MLVALAASPPIGLAQEPAIAESLRQAELTSILGDRAMTLVDALRIARRSSRGLAAASAQCSRTRAVVAEAKSALLPKLALSAQATEYDKANTVDMGALMGGPSLPLTIAKRWNPAVRAGLTVQIDISGAIRAAKSQAEFMALASRIDVDRVRNQLVFDVRTAFLAVLRAQGLRSVAEDGLAASRTRLHDAKLNEEVGNSPKFDVVSAERDLAEAEMAAVAADSLTSAAMARLKHAVGIDQSAQFSISAAGAGLMDAVPTPTYDELVSNSLTQRPEILEAQAMVEAAKHGIRVARRSSLPSLSAGLDYTYLSNHGAFTLKQSGSASVGLNIPLFDGGFARARQTQAEAEKAVAETAYQAAVDRAKFEIQTAIDELRQATARVKVADAGLAQAREAYRLAQVRYGVGVSKASVVSPQLELSSAQAALTQAANNRMNAIMDVLVALSSIDYAAGKDGSVGAD